jgi:excisionase family DNA binding protein
MLSADRSNSSASFLALLTLLHVPIRDGASVVIKNNRQKGPHDERREVIALSVAEAARAIGIGRTRFYELLSVGKIQAVRCGGRTLVTVAALRAFIDSLPPANFTNEIVVEEDGSLNKPR